MKKFVLMSLCAVVCFQLTACSGGSEQASSGQVSRDSEQTSDRQSSDKGDDQAEAALISDKLESGELLIDGKKYSFPSGISEWTSNGWHISNNYANTDTFELEYTEESNEFEVFSDDRDSVYVGMRAINFENDPKKIEESTTSYLSAKVLDGKNALNVELPGGITCKSTKEDVINAYGEPQEQDDEYFYYYYTNSDGLDIVVEIGVALEKVSWVSYALADSNWSSVTNAEECTQFIDDALKTSFYGEYENYVENKFDTAEGAQALYDSEIEYYAQGLMYYLDIDYETVDEGIAEGFRNVSKEVLTKFKWDKPVVDLEEGALMGSFEITMYPTDFLDIILEDAQAVADSGLDGNEYAQGMLDAVSSKVDAISYKDPVTMSYDIDTEDGIISQDTWDEIDDILMDFAE